MWNFYNCRFLRAAVGENDASIGSQSNVVFPYNHPAITSVPPHHLFHLIITTAIKEST